MLSLSFVRFGIVGIANTLIGLLVIFSAKWFLGLSDVVANVLGYTVGVLVSFVLNSRWSFRYRGQMWPAFFRFFVVLGAAYLTNLSVVLVGIHLLDMNTYLAQAAGVIPYALVFYLGSRLFAFREADSRRPLAVDTSVSSK